MKSRNYFLLLLIISTSSFGQSPKDKMIETRSIADTPAIVNNWSEAIFLFPPDYWENGRDKKAEEIIQQIGMKEFEQVKKFSHQLNIPCQFLIFCETRDGSPKKNLDTLRNKMNKLKAYKLATFTHINPANEEFPMVILKVPYKENTNWDTTAKWDSVYFIFPKDQIL